MDRPGELLGQRLVDQAVPLHPALPDKGRRQNIDPEVGLAFRPVTDMSGMEMRLVDDTQTLRPQCLPEFFLYPPLDRHDAATLFRETDAP